MEVYQGIKFDNHCSNKQFGYDQRLQQLNHWAYVFSQLGLAPVHHTGAFGNFSHRVDTCSFIISKTGMVPTRQLVADNYCLVRNVDCQKQSVLYDGSALPSSECFLHHLIYQKKSDIRVILHGHCTLFSEYANLLGIPQTKQFYPYGTAELAESALEMVGQHNNFFLLKDHGFVTTAEGIEQAGKLTLKYLKRLITALTE